MPAKHTARPLGPARIFLSAAAAVLVMLVVWIAVRAVGPAEAARQPAPTVVLTSMPQVPTSPSPTSPGAPSLSPATSSSPSLSPSAASPSRSSARPTATSHSPAPANSTTSKPAPTRTTPAPSADFAVTVTVTASWDQGYVASVRVQNNGNAAGSWTVTVSHANLSNLHLVNTWNATGKQSGDNVVLTGGSLAPGGSAGFGYQVSKTGRGNARPSGCAVVGGTCRVS